MPRVALLVFFHRPMSEERSSFAARTSPGAGSLSSFTCTGSFVVLIR